MQRPLPRIRSENYFVYEISEEIFLLKFTERFVRRRHVGAHPDGH